MTTEASPEKSIKVTKTVDASPGQLFAVLADPARHADVDGSDMLRGPSGDSAPVSAVGDEFIMKMHNDLLGDYEIRNVIVVFEQDQAIGWGPHLHPEDGYTDKIGDTKVGGHTFTWLLEPAGDGQTKVTQTYEWSGVQDENFLGMFPLLNADQLTDSIDRAASAAS